MNVLRMLILKQPEITLDDVMTLAQAHKLSGSEPQSGREALRTVKGYETARYTGEDTETPYEATTESEQVNALCGTPAPSREDSDFPWITQLCDYCGLTTECQRYAQCRGKYARDAGHQIILQKYAEVQKKNGENTENTGEGKL